MHFCQERKKNDLLKPTLSDQFPELVQQFESNPFPTKAEKNQLMETTGLSRQQIKDYFSYKRKINEIPSPEKVTITSMHPQLLEAFEQNPYPSKEEKHQLMDVTGLSRVSLEKWFQNRRKKMGDDSIEKLQAIPASKRKYSDRYPELLEQFDISPYPKPTDIDNLVTSTGMTKQQISSWFQYQRKKNDLVKKSLAARYPQLMEQFEKNPHPKESDISRLIQVTGLSRDSLYKWFKQNQRRKGLNGPVFSEPAQRSSLGKTYPELEQQFNINPYPSQAQS